MSEPEKKEKVLHARIPESLDHEVRRQARGLGISVSNLVRNVLLNSFGLVEDVMLDSVRIARSATGGADAAPAFAERRAAEPAPVAVPAAAPVVVGWQEIVLNVNAVCDRCNEILAKGTRAAMGLTQPPGGPFTAICLECLGKLESGDA